MRISRVDNCAAFGQLQTRVKCPYFINQSKLRACEKQLVDTKFVDVIYDSQGFAIKEKMADILYRIQSFSLFPIDKAVGIRMIGVKEPVFKFFHQSKEEAKSDWKDLCSAHSKSNVEEYTQVALWLEDHFLKKSKGLLQ